MYNRVEIYPEGVKTVSNRYGHNLAVMRTPDVFSVQSPGVVILNPGESQELTIQFSAQENRNYKDFLVIQTDYNPHLNIYVQINGTVTN